MRDTPRWSKSNRSASLSRTRPQARRLDANTANGRVEVDEDVLEMIRAISALAQKEAHDRILPLPLDPVKEKPVYAKADAGPAKFYSRQALDDIKAEQVAKQAGRAKPKQLMWKTGTQTATQHGSPWPKRRAIMKPRKSHNKRPGENEPQGRHVDRCATKACFLRRWSVGCKAKAHPVELPRVPARERATRSNGKNCRARAFFRELEKLASTRQLPFQHI